MLKNSLILSAALLDPPVGRAAPPGAPHRRVRPTDPEWPTADDWEGLRHRLAGELIRPLPLLDSCRTEFGTAGCERELQNPYYIGDHPAGTQVSGWFKAWTPMPSAYVVAARDATDVIAAVNFARDRNLRLVVKGGGHSYQGTSNAADSLLIWTRPMSTVVLRESFVATGCEGVQYPCHAVTIEAGAVWMDVYDAVTTRGGRYVQGGGCATVGVAGLVQSGGFGSFSKGFGTAAAGLLEADIVTADGQLRTVSARRDPNLFWAIKGGGGGNFGVVTKLTLRTHELPEFFGAAECLIQARSDADFLKLVHRFVDFYADHLFNPHWGETVSINSNNTLKISMVCQGLDNASARAVWEPFFSWVKAAGVAYQIVDELFAGARAARGWWDAQSRRQHGSTSVIFDDRDSAAPAHAWWSGDQEQVGAYLYGYDSVWLPASLLNERQRLTSTLFESSRHRGIELHFNKGLAGAPRDAIDAAADTAMNPAALHAFALAIVTAGGPARYPGLSGPPTEGTEATRAVADVELATIGLRRIAPAAGSYVSESNYFNPRWEQAFWGTHATRLRRVKYQYDPAGLFFTHHGVGSDLWSADGFIKRR